MTLKQRLMVGGSGVGLLVLCAAVIQYGLPPGQNWYENPAATWFAGKMVFGVAGIVMAVWPWKRELKFKLIGHHS